MHAKNGKGGFVRGSDFQAGAAGCRAILCYSLSVEKITLEQLSALVMTQAKEKGFGTKPEEINVGEKIALIHFARAACVVA